MILPDRSRRPDERQVVFFDAQLSALACNPLFQAFDMKWRNSAATTNDPRPCGDPAFGIIGICVWRYVLTQLVQCCVRSLIFFIGKRKSICVNSYEQRVIVNKTRMRCRNRIFHYLWLRTIKQQCVRWLVSTQRQQIAKWFTRSQLWLTNFNANIL